MNKTRALYAASVLACIAVTAAHAATRDEQAKACRRDAMHFCASHIPNRAKITACMKQHVDELSPPCRAMFEDDEKSGDSNGKPDAAQ